MDLNRHGYGLAVAIAVLAHPGDARALGLARGMETSFSFVGAGKTFLKPTGVRTRQIGGAPPGSGEMTVGLAGPGGAVQVAKLHVFERRKKVVTFLATAMRGRTRLVTAAVCGHLEMDAWVGLPATTSRVLLSRFAETDKPCD